LDEAPNILMDKNIDVKANTKAELWWIWNSIMAGIKMYNQWFINFDWVEGKSIINHPNRLVNQDNVIDFKKSHPGVKSVLLYFWANNPSATYWWLKKHVSLLLESWLQPVLSTCLFENKYIALKELNNQIRDLWRENSIPVLDFAKFWNQIDYSWSNPHPTVNWYKKMAKMIEVSCWLKS
jgi:hypothetical protein